MDGKEKIAPIILFVAGGLLVLFTPFVVIANIMQLAAGEIESIATDMIAISTLLTGTYFITYLACLITYLIKKNKKIILPIIPYIHLGLAFVFFLAWTFTV